MEADFPAAHSMDSTWFAVDKAGHVALFATGADGAVPNQAAPGPGAYMDVFDEMDELPEEVQESIGERPPDFLAELARLVPAVKPKADQASDRSDPPDAARHGLYVYGSDFEGVAGPYEREWVPGKPVHIDQLPPALRDALKAVQFPFRFADMPEIQPVEHVACSSWGPAWLGGDGQVRPIPGFEKDYAKVYKELLESFPEEKVEPPAQRKPAKKKGGKGKAGKGKKK